MILLDLINKQLWCIAIVLIIVNSVYFSIKLKFPQFKIFKSIKEIFVIKESNNISPRDTLIMALSSKIGVGSLSGMALCIYYGGIGTIFWMYISTIFLSIINYIENTLAIIYKENNKNESLSGPYFYINKGLNKKKLSIVYAVIVLILYITLFSSIQNNTIVTLSTSIFNINKIVLSSVISIITGIIIFKGINSISNICNKVFPVMIIIFITVGLLIIIKNITIIPETILMIIKEAFKKQSLKGGIIYTIIVSFQRSIFANESGVGTSAIISGATTSNNYKLQAKIGLIQTYFINLIILGITSIIIVTSKININNLNNGIEITKQAFNYHLGLFGDIILFIIIFLFSFSTIITIYYYGESSLKYLTNNPKTKILKIVNMVSIFFGGIINGKTIWSYIDILIALLTIINMYTIYKLRKVLLKKL